MIAVMVGALVLLMLGLAVVWLVSPAFRAWAEGPKFQMLEREALYERADADTPDFAMTDKTVPTLRPPTPTDADLPRWIGLDTLFQPPQHLTLTRKSTQWPNKLSRCHVHHGSDAGAARCLECFWLW